MSNCASDLNAATERSMAYGGHVGQRSAIWASTDFPLSRFVWGICEKETRRMDAVGWLTIYAYLVATSRCFVVKGRECDDVICVGVDLSTRSQLENDGFMADEEIIARTPVKNHVAEAIIHVDTLKIKLSHLFLGFRAPN